MRTVGRSVTLGDEGAAILAEMIRDARGAPRLTAWEERFLCDLAQRLRTWGPRTFLSMGQVDKLEEILNAAALPAFSDDELEAAMTGAEEEEAVEP